jgi:hypothetical protein
MPPAPDVLLLAGDLIDTTRFTTGHNSTSARRTPIVLLPSA